MIYLLRRKKLGGTSCKAISRFSKKGIQVVRNDARAPQGELVFRWGCTSDLPPGTKTVNASSSIHTVSNKLEFRKTLQAHNPPLGPLTWFKEEDVVLPAIIRPSFHHQGRHLYLVNTLVELRNAISICQRKAGGWYAAEVIKKIEEYRVFVVSGRVVCVARKYPANAEAIAWNVFQGGRFENVNWKDWPLKAVKISLEAFTLSGLDFGGVDVMVDAAGRAYVLEINAAPSLTSPYRQECFAKAFDWIIEKGKAVIPLSKEKGGYRKFIHPALDANALLGD